MLILLRQSTDRCRDPTNVERTRRPNPAVSSARARCLRETCRAAAVPDLEKFERAPDEPDDFRHRMTMNALGLAVTVVLVVTGIWIADVMAHMRKDQDCVLIGRSGCTRVDVPPQHALIGALSVVTWS